MKKYLVSICAAFAMFVMVSCTGNPGISAMKEFIANPTEETFKAVDAAEAEMTEEQKAEAEKWAEEHKEELAGALLVGRAAELE